jgi:DNA-binding response OmpR family regulator
VRIALLEDDPEQAVLAQAWMEEAGYNCRVFDSGHAFMRGVSRENFNLYIIDWGLPDTSGVTVLEWLRENLGWDTPVLFLTVHDHEEDIVMVLDKGADDYVVKGAGAGQVVARVNALLRRAYGAEQHEEVLEREPYRIEVPGRCVIRDGQEIDLTQKEFELTLFLFRNVGRLLSRGYILETVWGTRPDLNTRTVDTHVSRVRSKLGIADTSWRLSAVYQHGYRLEQVRASSESLH